MNNNYEQESYFYSSNKDLLDSYIQYAAEEYKTDIAPAMQLNAYIQTGNLNLITRANRFRMFFEQMLPPEEVLRLTSEYDMDEYVKNVLKGNKKIK